MPDQNTDRDRDEAADIAHSGSPEDAGEPGSGPDQQVGPEGAPGEEGGGGDPVAELTAALEQARQEAAEFKDQALRARAEAENVRRRTQRDVENAHKYGLEKFVVELLPVLDSLERAVDSCKTDAPSETVAAIGEGVELSLRMFSEVLAKAGIQAIDPFGEPFNPQLHEAMSMVESDAEPGSVVAVLQKGYTLNDRLVRAARVFVAKAPAGS